MCKYVCIRVRTRNCCGCWPLHNDTERDIITYHDGVAEAHVRQDHLSHDGESVVSSSYGHLYPTEAQRLLEAGLGGLLAIGEADIYGKYRHR